MADDVVLDVLIELKEEGLATAQLVASELEHLNREVRETNELLRENAEMAHRDARALLEVAGAATVAKGATGGSGVLGFVGALAMLMPGGTVMGYAILGVIGLAAALAPFFALLVGGIVLVTAFTVGIATLATVLTLGLGAFIAVGAAIAVLADQAYTRAATAQAAAARQAAAAAHAHAAAVNANAAAHLQLLRAQNSVAAAHHASANQLLAVQVAQQKVAATATQMAAAQYVAGVTSGQLVDPLGQVEKHLTAMADQLGFRGIPLLIQMAHWFDQLIPMVQQMGNDLITWFGDRLPLVLPIVSQMVTIMAGAFRAVGSAIGTVTDYVISHPQLIAFFKEMVGWGVSIGTGLINNLLKLSDWFLQRWPAIEKIVLPIFGGIGTAILGMGSIFGHVVDWFILKWPDFVTAAQKAADFFKAIWNNPLVQEGLTELKRLFKDVIDHLYELQPLIPIVGGILTGFLLGIEGALGGLLLMARTLEEIVASMKYMADHDVTKQGAWFDKLKRTDAGALQLSTPANSQMTGSPGEHGRLSSNVMGSNTTILPVVFSPIPPNREQLLFINEGLRRLKRSLV